MAKEVDLSQVPSLEDARWFPFDVGQTMRSRSHSRVGWLPLLRCPYREKESGSGYRSGCDGFRFYLRCVLRSPDELRIKPKNGLLPPPVRLRQQSRLRGEPAF